MQRASSNTWLLADLLEGWSNVQKPYADTMISGISMDSRFTSEGDLFLAVQGLQSHGLEFSDQAIEKGAAAIAWETDSRIQLEDLPDNFPCISIPILQQQTGLIAKRFFHHPSEHINIIAVTGTDGKTSVSQFIAQAFALLNTNCGVIGTLGYGVYPDLDFATHTTPDPIRIQAQLHHFYQNEVMHAVIEASSHGLKQGRLNSVDVNTAIFTNLGRDHMDYHQNFDDYSNSKRILFELHSLKNAVINIDDQFGLRLANSLNNAVNLVTYSQHRNIVGDNSFLYVEKILCTNNVYSIDIASTWGAACIETNLVGRFNISNLLAVMGALLVSGYSFEDAVKVISFLDTVPGRMEIVSENENVPTVIIDYAHTPQALNNVLQALKEQCDGKLWCVFGCGGDRDSGKRALMAEAVERITKYAVVTDDNPRSEDPAKIAKQIISGFSSSANYQLIHDRQKAIEYAIKNASINDTVLIAGKGHETVQIINSRHMPFNDRKVANQYLKEIAQ